MRHVNTSQLSQETLYGSPDEVLSLGRLILGEEAQHRAEVALPLVRHRLVSCTS